MADLFDGKMYCDKDQEWCPPHRRRNRLNTSWSHAKSPFLSRGGAVRNSRGTEWRQSFGEDSNDESSSYGFGRKIPSLYKGNGCPGRERGVSPESRNFAHARPRATGKRRLQQTGVICRPFVPYTQSGPQSVADGCEPLGQREVENVAVRSYTTEQGQALQEFQKETSTSFSNSGETGIYEVSEHQKHRFRGEALSQAETVEIRLARGKRQEGEISGFENSPRWSSDRSLCSSVGEESDSPYAQAEPQSGSSGKSSENTRLRNDSSLPQGLLRRAQKKSGRRARLSRTSSSSLSSRGSIRSRTSTSRRSEAKEMLSITHDSPRGQEPKDHNRSSHVSDKNEVAGRSRSISGEAGGCWLPTKVNLARKNLMKSGGSNRSNLPQEERRHSILSRTCSPERSRSRWSLREDNEKECSIKRCTQRRGPGTGGDPPGGGSRHFTRPDRNRECVKSDSAAATEFQALETDIRCRQHSPPSREQDSRSSITSSNLKDNCGENFRNNNGENASESTSNFRRDTRRNYARPPFRRSGRSRSSSTLSPASWRSRSLSVRRSRSGRSCLSGDRSSWVGNRAECGAFHGQRPWWKRKMWVGGARRREDLHGRDEGGAGWRREDDDGVDSRERSRKRYCGYSYSRRQNYDRRSPTYDSEEEYRRSRSREKARRKRQNETIQRYCRTSEGNYQVFWDGFQWVKKSDQKGTQLLYDQQMNATRRARRLHVGNLPLHIDDITEESFKQHLWKVMKENWACKDPAVCPILHVWFARDRGGNYGFMEMASVEEAHAALRLDGLLWHGVPIRINRPTEWKNSIYDGTALGMLAGPRSPRNLVCDPLFSASGLALAESLAAAAQQAAATGNNSGLLSLINSLPEDQRAAAVELVGRQLIAQRTVHLPFDLVQAQIQAELLRGAPSRIVHVTCPASTELENDADYDEILNDILSECNKHGHALAALIVTPHLEECLPSTSAGDVYLEYATCIQADNIILTFAGRMFDGKPLQLQRFNELAWRQSFQKHAKHLFAHVLSETIESHKKKADTATDTFTTTTAEEQKGRNDEEDGAPVDSEHTGNAVQKNQALVAAAAAAAAAGAEDCKTIAAACMAGAAAAVQFLGQSNSGVQAHLPRCLPPLIDIAAEFTKGPCSAAEGTGSDEHTLVQGGTAEAELTDGSEATIDETEKARQTTSARDSISTTCSL